MIKPHLVRLFYCLENITVKNLLAAAVRKIELNKKKYPIER